MNLDDEYAKMLDVLEDAGKASTACEWDECRSLVSRALSMLDRSGQGHLGAALHLSSALSIMNRDARKSGAAMWSEEVDPLHALAAKAAQHNRARYLVGA